MMIVLCWNILIFSHYSDSETILMTELWLWYCWSDMVVMETSDRQSGAGAAQGAGQGWYEGAVNHPSSPMPSQHHQVRIEN